MWDLASALAALVVAGGAEPMETSLVREFIDLLKTGGPYTLTFAAAWWGYRKDKDATEAAQAHTEQMKAMFDQVVNLTNSQTAAVGKMEAMLAALREAVNSLDRHMGK
jgi:hypothetical protein